MTIEELLKKNREIRELQDNNVVNTNVDTSIDNSTTASTNLSDIGKSVLQSQAIRTSLQNSNYASALTKASQEGEWISHEFDRDKLSDWAQHYYDEMNKSEANTEDYIKNQMLYSKVTDQMKLLGAQEVDFGKEISVGVRNSIANILLTGQKLSEELPLRTDTNMEEYYLKNIYYNNGKARTTRNSFTEESVANNLKDLKEAYKDDELIQKLYDTVIERKYNVASDDYFNKMSRYATEKLKELRYKESFIYERTRDEKEELEKLKRTEALSDYGKITQGVLDATGVVSNMAPSIAMGYVTGGIGELAGATGSTINTLSQIGSLGTMGTSAYGDAFDQSIKEGYGWGKSGAYADVVFATEVLSEVVGGEAVMSALGGAGSKTLTSDVAQKLISKGKNPLAKWMIGMAWDVGAEAIEEMIAEAIEPLAGKAILGKDITPEEYWKGILESAGGSVLPTLILGGFGKARIVNHVTSIDRALRVQLAELRAKNAITQEEYDTMKNDLTSWTNDAIAGVTEHYEEIKNEATGELEKKGIDYNDAMKQINDKLSKREQRTTEILNLASKLSKIETLTSEEKQSQIESIAKKYGITNEKLVELYNEFPNVMKDVLPSTYEQVQSTELNLAIGTNMVENIKSEINSKIDSTNKKAITLDILNSGNSKNEKPIENYNEKFLELAKANTPRKRDSGVVRLEINDNRSLADFKLGNFDESKKPTTQEISSSPILIESLVKHDASVENGEPTRKLYVYDNFDDFEKDIVTSFGSIEDFLNSRSNTVNTVITMSGKGGYEMTIEDDKVVWKSKSGETKTSDDERKVEPSKKKKKRSRAISEDAKDDIAKPKRPLYNQNRGGLNGEKQGRTSKTLNGDKNEARSNRQGTTDVQHRGIESKSNINDKYISSNKDVSNGIQNTKHDNELEKSSKQRKSIDKTTVEKAFKEVIKKYGTTTEYRYAGYLLPDGKMINLTDRTTGKRIPHSDIRTTGLDEVDYIYSGAIRLLPELGLWSMSENPTQEQFDFLEKYIDKYIHGSLKLPPGFENIDTFIDIYTQNGEIKSFEIPRDEDGSNATRRLKKYLNSIKENSNQSSFSVPKYTSYDAKENNIFMDMLTDIEAMYKMSDMEKKGSPVLETTDMINKGELPRQEGRNETSRVEITNMIKNFLKGKFGKLRGIKKRSAYGTHNRKSGWVRLGEITNIDTAFHELGHYINTTALKDKVDFDRSVKDELIKLCEARWSGRYKGETRLREGFAEAIRNWVEDREVFTINNPELVKFFEEQKTKSKELEDAFEFLEQLHEKVIDYENMTELQKARALRRNDTKEVNVDSMLRRMGTKIILNAFNDAVYSNKFDRFRAKVFGKKYADMLSIDKFEDTIKLAGNRDQTLTQLREGLINWNTGKKITHGLRAITEVVMPTKQQAKELGMKYDDLYAQNLDDAGLYAQLKRMKYFYESERDVENLGLRQQEVEKAIKQLVDETALSKEQLDEFTKMVNEDSKALINYAYEQRKISAEERDSLLADNQFYAPLNRITESEALGKNEKRRSVKRAFYRLEGSDLQLENPFIALASNWGSIIRAIDENNVYIRFAEMLKGVGEAGGDYGLWAETNVTPKMKFKGNIDLGAFEDTLRAQFKKMQEEYKIDTRNGDIVKLMNLDATASLFGLADIDADERIVSYADNGVRKYIQFADNDWGRGMFDLLTGVNNVSGDFYTSVAQELNAGLKMGATAMNMEFALGNMQSDAMMRYLTSDVDFIHRVYFPVITNVVNAINYMKHRGEWLPNWHPTAESEMYKKFEQSGVAQSGKFQSNLENLKKDRAKAFGDASDAIFKNVRKTKKFRKLSEVLTESKLGEFLSWIPEISEQATRFAEFSGVYNKMIKDGKSEAVAIREATMKARQVTQDFTVQGKMMRSINKVVPFASATVGGLYRMSQEARNHPERFTIRMSGLALMTLIISSLIKDDDREWYEEINEQKRFDNFILPNLLNPEDKQHPMIIKKPQGPARAFVNMVQMLYDSAMGYISDDEAEEVFAKWLKKSYEEVNPVNDVTDFMPGALIGFLENQVNLDFYYKTPIVPKELQNLDPRNQYDDTTSEFAKHIGKIFNWSPKKIDNAWEQMFAGTGKQFTNLYSDLIRLITGTENPLPAKDQSEYTFGSRVYVNALKNPTSVNKVYERIEELEREKAEGRMTDEQEAEYAKLQEAKSALAQISKQIKANRTDSSKTRKEKKERLDELQLLRADTARYYLGKTLLGKDSANNVELISFYPSNDTYTYTSGKNKYEVSFADEATKKEYAEMFKKEYEANLKKLRATAEYKKASATEKAELEKKAKSSARTSTTNKMKKIVYQRNK